MVTEFEGNKLQLSLPHALFITSRTLYPQDGVHANEYHDYFLDMRKTQCLNIFLILFCVTHQSRYLNCEYSLRI